MNHIKNTAQFFGKRGLNVIIRGKPEYGDYAKNVDQAIKFFKRNVLAEGVIKDLRKKEFHETKGQKRRRKLNAAKRRLEKDLDESRTYY